MTSLTSENPEILDNKESANQKAKRLNKRLKLGSKLKLPFGIKLALALSLLSTIIATGSILKLYYDIQRNLLKAVVQQLDIISNDAEGYFGAKEIEQIKTISQQIKEQSKPIPPDLLTINKPIKAPGLSENNYNKITNLTAYENLGKILGEITNESRRNEWSDVYIMASYLLIDIPESPDKKIVKMLVTDKGYRYQPKHPKNQAAVRDDVKNLSAGDYYFASSKAIREAFAGQGKIDKVYYHEDNDAYITSAIPLKDNTGNIVALLTLDVDVSSIAIEVNNLKWSALHILGGSLLASLLAAILMSKWLVKPIKALTIASQKIAERDFNIALNIQSNDEFQQLSDTFNVMIAEISKYTTNLENLVTERTALLVKAVDEIETDIEKGRKLQRDFLPEPLLELPNWEICAAFQPAKRVAGDFYDVFNLPNGNVGLVIADVCDKGVGAAMFMGLFRSFIRLFSGATHFQLNAPDQKDSTINAEITCYQQALKAVEITNNYVSEQHGITGMFATMFFGVLNPKTGLLTYINGGHESPLIINSDGIKNTLKSTGPAVGMMPNVKFKIQQIQLEKGDILFGYTDGLTDARSPDGEFFTTKKVLSLANQPCTCANELLERMKSTVFKHIDCAAQFDDITLLAVKWQPETTNNQF